LTEALEALRSEPALQAGAVGGGTAGDGRIKKLLGTRRKFSISGGGLLEASEPFDLLQNNQAHVIPSGRCSPA